jgi:cytochrome c oxidase cbb3-type subunit 3
MSDKHDPYKVKDTGHEWDGIKELDNPPPRWWMIGMHLSWITALIYLILFPSIPLVNRSTEGLLAWTQVKKLEKEFAEVEAMRAPYDEKLATMSLGDILADAELSNFAQGSARVLFGENCAACHGAGGQGATGFPVLADDEWLYGGSVETIVETITDGREGMMPAHATLLTKKELDDVVTYVVGLPEGKVHEAGKAVFMGETPSEAMCFGCHGEDAKGMPDMGAPNLSDSIWRFSGSEEGIRHTITHGVNDEEDAMTRKALMPAFAEKLSETQIKKLAVLVHQFGGGQ